MKLFDVKLSRTVPAPPEQVFEVWLDPGSPGGLWYGVERVIANPVVDGLFYHSVQHQGRSWAHYGRFLALERGRRIEHTWMSEATQGRETVVAITLTPHGGGTEVTLRHTGIPDDELGRSHEGGWKWYLDTLAEVMERRGAGAAASP